jgi:Fuc2NAc and GlcNAc transferase
VFITDATLTLFRRLLRGEKVYQAHRSHAYQHAALNFGAHGKVTLTVALVNTLWLLPIATLVAAGKVNAILGLLTAYLPLIWVAYKFDAGVEAA